LKAFLGVTGSSAENIRVVDVGSGTGNIGLAARKLGFESYVGIEPNASIAAYAREHLPQVTILERRLPDLGDDLLSSCDLALAVHVIEHARDGYEARDWVEGMTRVVRPGGYVLVVSPDVRDYKTAFWDIDWSHSFPTTPNDATQIFEDLNLQVVTSTVIRAGSLNGTISSAAWMAGCLIPTRPINAISRGLVGRDLATGLKVQALWGATFVLGQVRVT